jgi:hypothetical protein
MKVDTESYILFEELIVMVLVLLMVSLLAVCLLAPKYGVDSRPGFDGRPDWRPHNA